MSSFSKVSFLGALFDTFTDFTPLVLVRTQGKAYSFDDTLDGVTYTFYDKKTERYAAIYVSAWVYNNFSYTGLFLIAKKEFQLIIQELTNDQ